MLFNIQYVFHSKKGAVQTYESMDVNAYNKQLAEAKAKTELDKRHYEYYRITSVICEDCEE